MGELVWQKQTSIPDYLCFTALEAGQFTLTIPAAVTSDNLTYVEYSLDGRNWTRLTVDDTTQSLTTPTIQAGGKVYWRGSGIQYMTSDSRTNNYFIKTSYFSSSNRFDASGNIMSMLYAEDFEGKTAFPGTSNQYYNIGAMFQHCEFLVHAADLLLPATTLKHLCYTGMFFYCTMLVDAPSLPATVISNANYCYRYMFQGCSSLITPPDLSHVTTTARSGLYAMFNGCSSLTTVTLPQASHLMQYCYYDMYRGCTSITSADLSSARTIDTHACENMFYGCSSLSYVKCLATDISATDCLKNWLGGVSSTGTFIQAEGVEWPRGASGIPAGWVAIEKRTMPSGYKQVEYLQAVKPYPSNYNAAIVGTGIVLDPSQDTIEFAVWPRLDEDGYLINGGGSTAGEMPFANTSSPTSNTAKVGFFYTLYRVNSSTNLLSAFFTRVNGDGTNKALGSSLDVINKVTDNPQTIRVEFSATSSVMYLNGTQVASRSGYTVDTSDMTTMQAFVLAYNNKTYSWEHPFYYLKWWRSGTMIADYVPCVRESDGEVGFYDFVSQTFKTRYYTSSEPFTAGEEI